MKTSIFDMNLVLPPLVEMTEVEKDMPMGTNAGIRRTIFQWWGLGYWDC